MSKPTVVLGISGFYHDSAAAIVRDGDIVAAAQEERFTRGKHDPGFPQRAIEYCLREAGVTPDELDAVAFYEKPLTKFERLLETYLAFAPAGFASLPAGDAGLAEAEAAPAAGDGPRAERPVPRAATSSPSTTSRTRPAPSSLPRSTEAAILTLDGVGEWATATLRRGPRQPDRRHARTAASPTRWACSTPPSPTTCGFKVNSGEYKLMGLAPYGAAEIRGCHPREAARSQGRRLVPHGHAATSTTARG